MTPQDLILAFAGIPAQRYLYLGSNDPDGGGIQTIALSPSDVTIDDYLRLSEAIDRLTIYPASSVVFRVMDEFPFLGEEPKYEFCDATGLLPFCLCPHCVFLHRKQQFGNHVPVYASESFICIESSRPSSE